MACVGRTDGELIAAYRDGGDVDALVTLFKRYERLVYSVSFRYLKSTAEAEDVSAACFLLLVKRVGRLTHSKNLASWFYGMAMGTARNAARARQRRSYHEREAQTNMANETTSGYSENSNELLGELEIALAELPHVQREAIIMQYYQEMSVDQIAGTLCCPRGTVAARLRRGMERIRARLKGKDLTASEVVGALSGAHVLMPPGASFAAKLSGVVSGKISTGPEFDLVRMTLRGIFWAQVKSVAAVAVMIVGAGAGVTVLAQAVLTENGHDAKSAAQVSDVKPTGVPAQISNPVAGRESREEIFEFVQKPTITKRGDKFAIAFVSKGKCDATVAIVDGQGKVVRHLASGVLGKNAPWPFKQDSLAQSVEWDGKDDLGKPVSAGCKVKVGLGLKASYDKAFAGPPEAVGSGVGVACGLAVDKKGFLYLVQNASVRRYTRDGKYDRRIFPPPASVVTPDKFAPYSVSNGGIDYVETIWGDKVMVPRNPKEPWWGFNSWSFGSNQPLGAPAIGPDGQIAFAYESDHMLGLLHFIDKTGARPPGSSMSFTGFEKKHVAPWDRKGSGAGAHHFATSPDGQWLYISAMGYSVGRIKWVDLKGPAIKPETFKGEVGKPGKDNEHFDLPGGVACDADGNVLIADPLNDRIQIYKPDGGYLATVAVTRPQRIEVHPKTGAIYVLSWTSANGDDKPPVFVRKLSGWKEGGKELAVLEVKNNRGYYGWPFNAMGLDATAEPASLWVWDATGLFKITDKGNAFERGENVGTDKADPSVLMGTYGWDKPRIVVDRAREELYLGTGDVYHLGSHPWIRCNGRTGKKDPAFVKQGCDLALGPDDLIYVRAGDAGQFVVRYTRDGQPVPFKNGVKIDLNKDGGIVGGPGGKYKSGDYTAIYVASTRSSKIWQPGFAVGANGDIWVWANEQKNAYLNAAFDDQGKAVPWEQFEKSNWEAIYNSGDTPLRPGIAKLPNGGGKALIMVWDRDGRLKCTEAVENTQKGQCLRLDLQNNLYYLNQFSLAGKKGVNMECFKNSQMPAGMLVKISPKGSWPMARVLPKGSTPTLPGLTDLTHRDFPVEGVTWVVPNADDIFSGCQCHMFHFDLDSFARSFLPVGVLNSILVYDINGNLVARIGRYGNEDSRGPDSLEPDPEIGISHPRTVGVSDEALYIADEGNNRTLRVKLDYHSEESTLVGSR